MATKRTEYLNGVPYVHQDTDPAWTEAVDYFGPDNAAGHYTAPGGETLVEGDDRPTTPMWKFLAGMAAAGAGGQALADVLIPGLATAGAGGVGAGVGGGTTAGTASGFAGPTGSTLSASFGPTAVGGGGAGLGTGVASGGSMLSKLGSLLGGSTSWTSPSTILGLGQLGLGAAGAFMGDDNVRTGYTGDESSPNQLRALLSALSAELQHQQEKRAEIGPIRRRASYTSREDL
jgi:hypothetical protein